VSDSHITLIDRRAPRIVCNTRPGADWNTCGQAAIATVLAHFQLGPFSPGALRGGSIDDGAAIDAVRERFPADLPFGLGTTAARIAAALRVHGLAVERIRSGWRERGATRVLERLAAHVGAGHPVPVCLDLGRLDGTPLAYHWAVVTGITPEGVQLGNFGVGVVTLDRFLGAWQCRDLPPGHRHSAVIAWA